MPRLDTTGWNLIVGAALATSGCGARTIPADEVAGETTPEDETSPVGGPESAPECTSTNDCPTGYTCYSGVCEYYSGRDGSGPWNYYECFDDSECSGTYTICEDGACTWLGDPPPDCEMEVPAIPLADAGSVLALTFADVDDDGQRELVAATADALLVFESGGGAPTVSPREPGEIAAMVTTDHDPAPGEDVLLLIGDTLVTYASNGVDGFALTTTDAPPLVPTTGLLAANLDGQPPLDLIGWGEAGAFVLRNGEATLVEEQIHAAAAFEFGGPSSYILRNSSSFRVYDEQDQVTGSRLPFGQVFVFATSDGEQVANYTWRPSFTVLEVWDAVTLALVVRWPIPGNLASMLAGDLDGDGTDELLLTDGGSLTIHYRPLEVGECLTTTALPDSETWSLADVGDFDGDGDEELALLSSTGAVALVDGG